MNIKRAFPWQAKIVAKIVLSRTPFGYGFWRRLNLFKHGGMEDPEYALAVFATHFNRVNFSNKHAGFTVMEIGPGDSVSSALISRAYGAARCYLLDRGSYARRDIAGYRKLAAQLLARGLEIPDLDGCEHLADLLQVCGAVYLTGGLSSFSAIPDGSIDFIWSHAVLQHIRRQEFGITLREMRRVLRPGGVCSHRVDLRDTLGGKLNNLRFSCAVWESDFMARSGFYTNRIRYQEMLQDFVEAGFAVQVVNLERFSRLPTRRERMAPEFRDMSDEELLVSSFDVILRYGSGPKVKPT